MAATVVDLLGGARGRVAVDDYTMPMWSAFPVVLAGAELVDAGPLFTTVRLHKTPDEIECLRRSWRMNEAATRSVEGLVRPGVRTSELSGAYLSAPVPAGSDRQLPRPRLPAHARPGGRRALEHQR